MTAPTIATLLTELKRLESEATPGPLSWSYIGDKMNGYVIGVACREDGTPLVGHVSEDDMVEDFLALSTVGEHEAATCNYVDPAFVVALRNAAPTLLAALEQQQERIDALRGTLTQIRLTTVFRTAAGDIVAAKYARQGLDQDTESLARLDATLEEGS